MVSDGYIRRMVQAFNGASPAPALKFGGSPDHALKIWFSELDVDWVLQIDDEQGLRRLLRDKPAMTQDLVDKWIRALIVIVASITEFVFPFYRTPAVALFGKASITEMLDVVDVIITVLEAEAEKLQAVLNMFRCVCGASQMFTPVDRHLFRSPKHFQRDRRPVRETRKQANRDHSKHDGGPEDTRGGR